MDKAEFRRRHGDRIQVVVDWERFAGPEWRIEELALSVPADLGKLWTPWRRKTKPAEPGDPPPLSVVQAASDAEVMRDADHRLAKQLARWQDGVTLELPAFALPDGMLLLLDGNHKVVAAAVRRGSAALKLAVIRGPNADLFPDLAGWANTLFAPEGPGKIAS